MRTTTKITALVGAAAITVATAGTAYAYWTTTGSGSGSATSTHDVGTDKISLAQVGTLTGFYPGITAKDIKVQATNPAAYSQKVGEVTVTVAASGTSGACAADNWTITNVDDSFGVLGAGASSDAAGLVVATITLRESGSNQDACKDVSPALTFTSAGGE